MIDNIIKVPIEPFFAGEYRLEYDGKYITLFGRDKTYPITLFKRPGDPEEYEEMLLSHVIEIRNAGPEIIEVTDKEIVIDLFYYEKPDTKEA